MVELDGDVLAYYTGGSEQRRLLDVHVLERVRTEILLRRFLPAPPAAVLDVGGGPGIYARWLAELGYDVRLIDPVPLHVEQAAHLAQGDFAAELGDARSLPARDSSVDAVLLLGPLYHLVEATDRQLALQEAQRVCRPGGVVLAAAISRWAGLLTTVNRHLIGLDRLQEWWTAVEASDGLRGRGLFGFTTAKFHRTGELRQELMDSGLVEVEVFGIEGIGGLLADEADRMADPEQREVLLMAAAITEQEPELAALSNHLLGVGRKPG